MEFNVQQALQENTILDGEIYIGGVLPLTGPWGPFSYYINQALSDVFTMANEEGGINGKKIGYLPKDTTYDTKLGTRYFRNLVTEFKAVAIYGDGTKFSKAIAPEIRSRSKVLYGSPSFSSELADAAINPLMFVPGPTYSDQVGMILKFIHERKEGTRVAFVHSDDPGGRDPFPYARVLCQQRYPLEIVADEALQYTNTDYRSTAQRLHKAAPDYLIFQLIPEQMLSVIISHCLDLQMKCKFFGTIWGTTELLVAHLGELAENYYGVCPYNLWHMTEVPMIRKIREFNARRRPEVHSQPMPYMQGFVTGMIFVETLRRADAAGSLDEEGLIKALQSIKDFDTQGLTAPLTNDNNRFPIARIWQADVLQKCLQPVSDWIQWSR